VARTSAALGAIPVAGLAGTLLAMSADGIGLTAGVAALNGLLLTLAYIHWYSRFGERALAGLAVGQQMPDVTLHDLAGQSLNTQALTRQTALWLFYRGNWCPLCMAQIREVAADYRRLQERGVEVYLISPQPQDHSRSLAERFEAPMRFLRDVDNRTAARLGILAKGGLPMGMQALGYDSDVPMPTVFITAPGGRIVYSDLTDNYRVRPEPAEFIKALDAAGL
jgi:peroxiredoxin